MMMGKACIPATTGVCVMPRIQKLYARQRWFSCVRAALPMQFELARLWIETAVLCVLLAVFMSRRIR